MFDATLIAAGLSLAGIVAAGAALVKITQRIRTRRDSERLVREAEDRIARRAAVRRAWSLDTPALRTTPRPINPGPGMRPHPLRRRNEDSQARDITSAVILPASFFDTPAPVGIGDFDGPATSAITTLCMRADVEEAPSHAGTFAGAGASGSWSTDNTPQSATTIGD